MTIYTAKEMAAILKVKQHTIYDYVRQGKLSATHIGTTLRFTEDDLNDFLNHGRRDRRYSANKEK